MIISILSHNNISSTIDIKYNSMLYNLIDSFKKSNEDIFIITSRMNSNDSHKHIRKIIKIIDNYILSDTRYFDEYYIKLIEIGVNYIINNKVKIFDYTWYNQKLLGTKITNNNQQTTTTTTTKEQTWDDLNITSNKLLEELIANIHNLNFTDESNWLDEADCSNKTNHLQLKYKTQKLTWQHQHILHGLDVSRWLNIPIQSSPLNSIIQMVRQSIKENKKIEYKETTKQKNENFKSQLNIKKKQKKNYK